MEKKWLLRLPRDLDDWLTLKAAEETVQRGRRISKNTLIIELASKAREGALAEPRAIETQPEQWQDLRSALEFIQKEVEESAEEGSPDSERLRQRISVNLKLLESYIEDLEG